MKNSEAHWSPGHALMLWKRPHRVEAGVWKVDWTVREHGGQKEGHPHGKGGKFSASWKRGRSSSKMVSYIFLQKGKIRLKSGASRRDRYWPRMASGVIRRPLGI